MQEVEVGARKDLHDRYAIEAVPMILVADDDGDVRASFIGAPTAADLWAALAELREPGSTPSGVRPPPVRAVDVIARRSATTAPATSGSVGRGVGDRGGGGRLVDAVAAVAAGRRPPATAG